MRLINLIYVNISVQILYVLSNILHMNVYNISLIMHKKYDMQLELCSLKNIQTLADRPMPTMVLHSKNPLWRDDAKESCGPVGYIKEPFLIQKNPMPSKEPPVAQKNPKGSLNAAKEPSFLRVYDPNGPSAFSSNTLAIYCRHLTSCHIWSQLPRKKVFFM